MDYKGKVCPYCKTEFKDGDDVVVCSLCEIPLHRECRKENGGCITPGCDDVLPGIKNDDDESTIVFCRVCGAEMHSAQKFCSECGSPANAPRERDFASNDSARFDEDTYTDSGYTGGYNTNGFNSDFYTYNTDPDLYAFVAKRQNKYIQVFEKMRINNSKTSWNWCAFLFGHMWFLYRKMYSYAAAYIALVVLGFIFKAGNAATLVISVFSGIYGNYLYKNYVDKELQAAKAMDLFNKNAHIAKKGGTNGWAVFAFWAVCFALGFFLELL